MDDMKHLDRGDMMELYDAYTQLMKIERTLRPASRGRVSLKSEKGVNCPLGRRKVIIDYYGARARGRE